MEKGTKSIELAVGLSILCCIFSLVFLVLTVVRHQFVQNQNYVMNHFATPGSDSSWMDYAGSLMRGAEVQYVLEKYDEFFCVRTKKDPVGFIVFEESSDLESSAYINPVGRFVCTAYYDVSEVVGSTSKMSGLCFTEIGSRKNFYTNAGIQQNVAKDKRYFEKVNSTLTSSCEQLKNSLAEASDSSNKPISQLTLYQEMYRLLYLNQLRNLVLQGLIPEGGD